MVAVIVRNIVHNERKLYEKTMEEEISLHSSNPIVGKVVIEESFLDQQNKIPCIAEMETALHLLLSNSDHRPFPNQPYSRFLHH